MRKTKKPKNIKQEIHLHTDPNDDLLKILEQKRGQIINEKKLRNTIMSNLLIEESP
jgi:hypothetical protein